MFPVQVKWDEPHLWWSGRITWLLVSCTMFFCFFFFNFIFSRGKDRFSSQTGTFLSPIKLLILCIITDASQTSPFKSICDTNGSAASVQAYFWVAKLRKILFAVMLSLCHLNLWYFMWLLKAPFHGKVNKTATGSNICQLVWNLFDIGPRIM